MGSFGGDSFAGGTATFGGDESPERLFFELYRRFAGRGALALWNESTVRARWMQGLGDMAGSMESEAIKQAMESVPCTAIDQLDEWEAAFRLNLPGERGTTFMRQQFLLMIMNFCAATANITRIANAVARILDVSTPDGGAFVSGHENTGATINSPDGIRYFCILVSQEKGAGKWLTKKAQRPLFRGLEAALRIIAPAHTVPALSTSDNAAGDTPEFYTDGFNGCACDKDCVGS